MINLKLKAYYLKYRDRINQAQGKYHWHTVSLMNKERSLSQDTVFDIRIFILGWHHEQ